MVLEVNRQPDFEGFERTTKFHVATEVVRYICQRVEEIDQKKVKSGCIIIPTWMLNYFTTAGQS
jgi:hypothetical protein